MKSWKTLMLASQESEPRSNNVVMGTEEPTENDLKFLQALCDKEWKDLAGVDLDKEKQEVLGKPKTVKPSKLKYVVRTEEMVLSRENMMMRIPSMMVESLHAFREPSPEKTVDKTKPFWDLDEIPVALCKPGLREAARTYRDTISTKKNVFFQDTAVQQEMREMEELPNEKAVVVRPTLKQASLGIILEPKYYHSYLQNCEHSERVQILEKVMQMEQEKILPVKTKIDVELDVRKVEFSDKYQVMVRNNSRTMCHAEVDLKESMHILDVYHNLARFVNVTKRVLEHNTFIYIWNQGVSGLVGPVRKYKLRALLKGKDKLEVKEKKTRLEVTIDDDMEVVERVDNKTGQRRFKAKNKITGP